jgi:hypothetical protein
VAEYRPPDEISLIFSGDAGSLCLQYAADEAARLLGRLGVSTGPIQETPPPAGTSGAFLRITTTPSREPSALPSPDGVSSDGYLLHIRPDEIVIAGRLAKGVLNGVYDLAERLGYLFLMPGEEGEWPPLQNRDALTLECGEILVNPRFAHRGVYWQPEANRDYTAEEVLRFYAKLRFNAMGDSMKFEEYAPIAERLGIRLEIGGHGLPTLLPRELFEEKPELFRMYQPEDFGGGRMKDFNLCVTHPESKKIIQEHYRKKLEELKGKPIYALHAWPDDLMGGGWCLCPSCRALSPCDQATLAMRHLAEVVAEGNYNVRIPLIAYHDTMHPGNKIAPPPEAFLLFAPRERCYAHPLDDPSCRRNRFYMEALKEWSGAFKGIDDAHTFEYYTGILLFRCMYPFMPDVVIREMDIYKEHDIETHCTIIGGLGRTPWFNLLVFARAHWDDTLTPEGFIQGLAEKISPGRPDVWEHYLYAKVRVSAKALQMCEHDFDFYMDLRWLPETTKPYGDTLAKFYREASRELLRAADALEAADDASLPERAKGLAAREAARARWEAAELEVMHVQQKAVNNIGKYLNSGNREFLRAGIEYSKETLAALDIARTKAQDARIPDASVYVDYINRWLYREFRTKVERYSQLL